jgi:ABC-type Fe3+ transport system substrate-binding protein
VAEVLVYAHGARADTIRALLAAACNATGIGVRLELFGSGSLYQRLGSRRGAPWPDIVSWFGPFAAHAAGLDGLLQSYQPPNMADANLHDPDWKWTALDYSAVGVAGGVGVGRWQDLASVPRLAMADPERSEVGLSLLLASLDRARVAEGDAELGWRWWQQRVHSGLALAEEDSGAVELVQAGSASHALTLSGGVALAGLAPIPHAIGLAANSRNADAARRVLDWLTSASAGGMLALSAWQAATNGLAGLMQAAAPLDVDWCRQQYAAARQRWAASGFGPELRG